MAEDRQTDAGGDRDRRAAERFLRFGCQNSLRRRRICGGGRLGARSGTGGQSEDRGSACPRQCRDRDRRTDQYRVDGARGAVRRIHRLHGSTTIEPIHGYHLHYTPQKSDLRRNAEPISAVGVEQDSRHRRGRQCAIRFKKQVRKCDESRIP